MTQEEKIRDAANEYARNNCDDAGNVESSKFAMSQHGFVAGANWAYQHGCIDPDSAELAGYKRGVERAIEVLRATGYFRHLSEVEGFSETTMEEQFKETMY